MATLADYFKGRVNEDETCNAIGVEWSGSKRYPIMARQKTQTFVFEGVPGDIIDSTSAVTVTDVNGTSYTITPVTSFTDGSTGSATYCKEAVRVTRSRMSPHMWILQVTRTGGPLYRGTARIIEGPSWYNP